MAHSARSKRRFAPSNLTIDSSASTFHYLREILLKLQIAISGHQKSKPASAATGSNSPF
jgi:hypothetical protein